MVYLAHPVYAISAAMLFIALLPLPYGYYGLLRITITLCTTLTAYYTFKKRGYSCPTAALAIIALLFNPIIEIHLSKGTWQVIDIMTGTVFLYLTYQSYRHQEEQ